MNGSGKMIGVGDLVTWETLNGEGRGRVVAKDTLGLGYMAVKLTNGRRVLVHERSTTKKDETVAEREPMLT